MDIVNSEIKETAPVPESVPAPVASVPEVPAPPAVSPAPVTTVAAAPALAPAVKGEMPKTTGKTPGGWNRFAGYNPNDAKNKKNDRRGDSSKGRR